MIEFGATLRQAREAKGITPAQLAQSTHLMIQQIEALENEDFSNIAAPIYGRGFVKLYCEAVGLEPQPMINEFMEIFSGNRIPTIRTRPPKSAPPPIEPPAVLPDDFTPPEAGEPDDETSDPPGDENVLTLESEVIRTPPPVEPEPAPVEEEPFAFDGETGELPFPEDTVETPRPRGPSRYSRPTPIDDEPRAFRFRLPALPQISQPVKRILLLVAAGLALLWLVIAGFRAAYRAAMTGAETEHPAASETTDQTTAADGRSLKTIPAPYID